jgi:exportin-1
MPSTAAMGTLADEAAKLLDFNQKLDISLLDSIVTCMYTGDGQRVSCISVILSVLRILGER